MASSIKARIALPAFLLKRVAANRSRSNALSLCLRLWRENDPSGSFSYPPQLLNAKPLHTFARHAVGNAARLSLLVALLVVPGGLGLGGGGLVVKSGAAYASDNGKMNEGLDNAASASDVSDPGPGFGSNSSADGGVNVDTGGGVASNMDDGSSDNPGNGQNTSSDDDKAGNSSSGGTNGEESEDGESHRGAIRPANLTEFLSSLRNGSRIVSAERSSNKIEIQYSDGWREQIEDGVYTLAGPNDNVVIRRPATKRDYQRLNSAF